MALMRALGATDLDAVHDVLHVPAMRAQLAWLVGPSRCGPAAPTTTSHGSLGTCVPAAASHALASTAGARDKKKQQQQQQQQHALAKCAREVRSRRAVAGRKPPCIEQQQQQQQHLPLQQQQRQSQQPFSPEVDAQRQQQQQRQQHKAAAVGAAPNRLPSAPSCSSEASGSPLTLSTAASALTSYPSSLVTRDGSPSSLVAVDGSPSHDVLGSTGFSIQKAPASFLQQQQQQQQQQQNVLQSLLYASAAPSHTSHNHTPDHTMAPVTARSAFATLTASTPNTLAPGSATAKAAGTNAAAIRPSAPSLTTTTTATATTTTTASNTRSTTAATAAASVAITTLPGLPNEAKDDFCSPQESDECQERLLQLFAPSLPERRFQVQEITHNAQLAEAAWKELHSHGWMEGQEQVRLPDLEQLQESLDALDAEVAEESRLNRQVAELVAQRLEDGRRSLQRLQRVLNGLLVAEQSYASTMRHLHTLLDTEEEGAQAHAHTSTYHVHTSVAHIHTSSAHAAACPVHGLHPHEPSPGGWAYRPSPASASAAPAGTHATDAACAAHATHAAACVAAGRGADHDAGHAGNGGSVHVVATAAAAMKGAFAAAGELRRHQSGSSSSSGWGSARGDAAGDSPVPGVSPPSPAGSVASGPPSSRSSCDYRSGRGGEHETIETRRGAGHGEILQGGDRTREDGRGACCNCGGGHPAGGIGGQSSVYGPASACRPQSPQQQQQQQAQQPQQLQQVPASATDPVEGLISCLSRVPGLISSSHSHLHGSLSSLAAQCQALLSRFAEACAIAVPEAAAAQAAVDAQRSVLAAELERHAEACQRMHAIMNDDHMALTATGVRPVAALAVPEADPWITQGDVSRQQQALGLCQEAERAALQRNFVRAGELEAARLELSRRAASAVAAGYHSALLPLQHHTVALSESAESVDVSARLRSLLSAAESGASLAAQLSAQQAGALEDAKSRLFASPEILMQGPLDLQDDLLSYTWKQGWGVLTRAGFLHWFRCPFPGPSTPSSPHFPHHPTFSTTANRASLGCCPGAAHGDLQSSPSGSVTAPGLSQPDASYSLAWCRFESGNHHCFYLLESRGGGWPLGSSKPRRLGFQTPGVERCDLWAAALKQAITACWAGGGAGRAGEDGLALSMDMGVVGRGGGSRGESCRSSMELGLDVY